MLVTNPKDELDNNSDLNKFFINRYFYSKIVYDNANKVVDILEKKIHSTNPYSLIFKKNNLPENMEKLAKPTIKKLIDEGVYNKNMDSKEMFSIVITKHFQEMNKFIKKSDGKAINVVELSKKYMKLCIDVHILLEKYELTNKIADTTPINIFMDVESSDYDKYNNYYLAEKIFLKEEYNLTIDNRLYGASSLSTSLGYKKPILSMNTMGLKAPNVITIDDAIATYKLSYILKDEIESSDMLIQLGFENTQTVILSMNHKDNRVRSREYYNMKIINNPKMNINPNIIPIKIDTKDIQKRLNAYSKGIFSDFIFSRDIKELQNTIRKIYSDSNILNPLIKNKGIIKDYFRNGTNRSIEKPINEFTDNILNYEIKNTDNFVNNYELQKKWDFKVSIMTYFSERSFYKDMAKTLSNIQAEIIDEFNNSDNFVINSDEMYYFLAGQTFQYLVGLSKSINKTGRMIQPFLRLNNKKDIDKMLSETYAKYSHSLVPFHNNRINRVIRALTIDYTPENSLKNKDMNLIFKGGLIGDNIYHTKKQKETDVNEEN